MKKLINQFFEGYKFIAVTCFNLALLLFLINVCAGFFVSSQSYQGNDVIMPLQIRNEIAEASVVYPDKSKEEIDQLLLETWSRPITYEPLTQFRESAYQGKFINQSKFGFREFRDRGPWPPDAENYNIFIFGGSTTFGYGVTDDETIAAHMQKVLNQENKSDFCVYNFGQGFYYSTQERLLFEKLVMNDYRPDCAIFVDGFNEFYFKLDRPMLTPYLEEYLYKVNHRKSFFPEAIASTSTVRMLMEITGQERGEISYTGTPFEEILAFHQASSLGELLSDDATIDRILKRYVRSCLLTESMGNYLGIETIFIWQPVSTYKYPHNRPVRDIRVSGYERFESHLDQINLPQHFFWLADMHAEAEHQFYVDRVHYSSEFSALLAGRIAGFVDEVRASSD